MRYASYKYAPQKPYQAIPRDGFPSCKHAYRASRLKTLEADGRISDLKFEVPFSLEVKEVFIARYIADFTYKLPNGRMIVEDVKGRRSPIYEFKKKLMKACLNIEIIET